MRSALVLSLGIVSVFAASNQAGDNAPKEVPKPPKGSYVKIRVEVEIRGALAATDKGVTVTAQDRIHDLFHPHDENPDWTRPATFTLDFSRARQLGGLAKKWHGKEVVVTGMAEVRRYVQKVSRPAGGQGFGQPYPLTHHVPSWHLEHAVQVTGLKSADDE